MQILYKKMKALWCFNDDYFIGYRKCRFYKCYLNRHEIEYICDLPIGMLKKFCSVTRIMERAIHINPRAVIKLNNDSILIGISGNIYRLMIKEKKIIHEHSFSKEMSSPLMFAKIQNLRGFKDSVIYGEYTNQTEQHAISIYSRGLNINDKWEKCYTFKTGLIQHIHGFIINSDKANIIIMTGDSDNESGFWKAENNFSHVESIIIGSQRYRACVGMLSNCGMIYATDNPYAQNYIYEFCFNKEPVLKKIVQINGTVINGIMFKDKLYLSTTVESIPFTKNWQKFLPRRLARGVKDRNVEIITCDADGNINNILNLEKDNLFMPLFQFGMVEFCQTDGNKLLCNPIAVKKYDNCVIEL